MKFFPFMIAYFKYIITFLMIIMKRIMNFPEPKCFYAL